MSALAMLITGIGIYFCRDTVMRIFTSDAEVTQSGEYLRCRPQLVASGVTFVSSSMFQALGNTMPSLATSALRLVISIIPAIFLSRVPGFHLTWIWYLSAVSVFLQMTANLLLLQREFRLKLPEPSELPVAVAG